MHQPSLLRFFSSINVIIITICLYFKFLYNWNISSKYVRAIVFVLEKLLLALKTLAIYV